MPTAREPSESLAGSAIRITRAAGSWSPPRHAATLRRALLVACSLGGCAGAAFAGYGIWQLAATVDALIELVSPIDNGAPPSEPSARVAAPVASISSTTEGSERAPSPAADEGPTQPAAVAPATAEASESPIPVGALHWPEYTRTECTGIFVYIVTTSEHAPRESAASLAFTENGRARFRRAGQMLGDWEVLGITDDWSGLNPAVWLVKDHEVCRAELAGNPTRVHVALNPPAKKRKPKRRRGRARRRR